MPQMVHHIADPLRRSRIFWGGVCWVATLLMIGFGGTYLIGGAGASAVPSAFDVLVRDLPGGVHTYGGILVVPGLLVLNGLVTAAHRGLTMRDDYLHHVLPLMAYISLGAVGLNILLWVSSGTRTWGSILLWLAVCGLAVLAWACPPDKAPARRRRAS